MIAELRKDRGEKANAACEIAVRHFPPGTSKWNKIEHRLFCHVTQNWRGRPLVSHETMVNLIANTTTTTGLRVKTRLDSGRYPLATKVSDAQMATINTQPAEFHGEWNYTIKPRAATQAANLTTDRPEIL